jgi:alginate O-acetyltransferase complex protein AlgI
MVFSSPTFLFLFLPAVLLATWAAPTPLRRFVLLAASLGFYAWGVQEFLLVIVGSTLIDWALARGIARRHDPGGSRSARWLLLAGLTQNLGLLAYFKYGGFASEQAARLTDLLGLGSPGTLEVVLPIGISFFTFEKISYLVDVWRGDVKARRDPFDVLLFVALFPRSIAGPIVRLREIQHELRRPQPTLEGIGEGSVRFSQGLAKKVLIADQIAPVADACFASAGQGTLSLTAAWLGALAYSLQLYFDFSGYSDMAIGIARMLGFKLPENFNRPYSAVSVTDFWRRWHMTLSRWFRDYVYIPLGGNRGNERATTRNLLIVFGLTGLWHGAAWAFVIWGFYHGAWLILERRFGWRALDGQVRFVVLRRALLVLIVVVGWVMFRAESMGLALDYYRAMLTPSLGLTPEIAGALGEQARLTLAIACLVFLLPREPKERWLRTPNPSAAALVARTALVVVALPYALAMAFSSTFSPFLYFQF